MCKMSAAQVHRLPVPDEAELAWLAAEARRMAAVRAEHGQSPHSAVVLEFPIRSIP